MDILLEQHDLDGRAPGLVLHGRSPEREQSRKERHRTPIRHQDRERRPFGGLKGLVDPLAVTNDNGEFRLGVTKKDTALFLEVTAPFLAPAKVGPLKAGMPFTR